MAANWKKALWSVLVIPFLALGVWLLELYYHVSAPPAVYRPPALRIVIADPLSGPRADGATPSPGRRDYTPLAALLETRLGRPVDLLYSDNPDAIFASQRGSVDLIVGKAAAVSYAATEANEPVRPLARLTNRDGTTEVRGLFVVRRSDPARTLGDLADHRILFGPPGDDERHAAALVVLAAEGVTPVPPLQTMADRGAAVRAVVGGDADVALISDYAAADRQDDEAINQGVLRIVGRTTPVPFITVFATETISPGMQHAILDALFAAGKDSPLLEALQSKAGFVAWDAPCASAPPAAESESAPAASPATPVTAWTDWRGPGRAALSPDVPTILPEKVNLLWKRGLTGPGLAGVAATATHVMVADKSAENDQDIWRCLDADTGRELWTIAYRTPTEMEFTNAPRATPVIHGGFVYLLGAFGDLYCVDLYGGRIVWQRNISEDFGAKLPRWGTCATPLIVDDALIVNPGAEDASLVALGLHTGEVLWKTPGEPAAYAALILGTFGGVRQIVGYDAVSLGGWDPNTGRRLWKLRPDKKGDYNVPTPVNVAGRLLVATENNGARLYGFDDRGRIVPAPVAWNPRFAPDTSTPVVVDGLVFGNWRGLFCLDANDLQTRYMIDDDKAFCDYAAFVAGHGHVLAVTVHGELILLEASSEGFTPVSRLRVFQDTEVWSHPALVGNRLYLRSMKEICCLLFDTP
jgi:outer membrane protein assembly factor BamB